MPTQGTPDTSLSAASPGSPKQPSNTASQPSLYAANASSAACELIAYDALLQMTLAPKQHHLGGVVTGGISIGIMSDGTVVTVTKCCEYCGPDPLSVLTLERR